MRTVVRNFAVTGALVLAWPAAAAASSLNTQGFTAGVAMPTAQITSATTPPPGFSTNAVQAMAAAKAVPALQSLHRREHPLQIRPMVWISIHPHWVVYFAYRGQIDAQVDLTPAGHVQAVWTGPLARAPYAHGHYAPVFDSGWVIVPFSLLFLLPFLDPRRLRRLVHLDALVVLSFLISYALFDHLKLQLAVWMAYPPLIYLLFRMLAVGRRGGRGIGRLAPLLSTRVAVAGLLVLMGARIWLSLAGGTVMDVGFASVIGAHRIVHGQALYWAAAAHGDTYGPIAYLAYVPFELLWPWHGAWDYLPAARAASIFFDVVTVVALVGLGRQLRRDREGIRLGLVFGWAWAACPFTLLGLMMHSNDGLIAMLAVLGLLCFGSPAGRGALLGLAAAAKFSPAALLPLYAAPRNRSLRGAAICVASFAAVVVLSIALYLPRGGLSEFYSHTLGFQLSRSDVFSPWALHPGLAPLKLALEIGAVALAAAAAWVPRERSIIQVCALAAAVTIAVQLPAVHWFYYYILWFVPFLIVGTLAPGTVHEAATEVAALGEPTVTAPSRQPALAGA